MTSGMKLFLNIVKAGIDVYSVFHKRRTTDQCISRYADSLHDVERQSDKRKIRTEISVEKNFCH